MNPGHKTRHGIWGSLPRIFVPNYNLYGKKVNILMSRSSNNIQAQALQTNEWFYAQGQHENLKKFL